MIAYLDTSALVPLLVAEPGTHACRQLWEQSDDVVTNRVAYVEASGALAMAERRGRLSAASHRQARRALGSIWVELNIVDLDQDLAERAAEVTRTLGLRGYDAVHCASAESLVDEDVVAAAGDRALLRAWGQLGLATFDATQVLPG